MLLRRLVGETIALDVVHGRDLWLVKADLNQFEQVIVNLVVNARDAMPERRQDHASHPQSSRPPNALRLKEMEVAPDRDYVDDRGRGHRRTAFPADVLRQDLRALSSPPRRSAKAPASACRWSMASSSRRAATCYCESEPGKGATFRILLPRLIEAEADEPAKKEAAEAGRRPHRPGRNPARRGRGGGARLRRPAR